MAADPDQIDQMHQMLDESTMIRDLMNKAMDDMLWEMSHGPKLGPPSPPRIGPPLPDYHDECEFCPGHPGYRRDTSDLPAWPRVTFDRSPT